MANFGFLIDNRKCIGCHACSTACKAENSVPLGVNRTWVKYTEKGVFPHTRRFFQVTRCNHCANPPCVTICPTAAMYQRADGIVEFDPSACIGCKACLQACPYDAIYIEPDSHTAAKCHFCAHRTDVGLEPACVIVCPEHAILSGDLDDPASEIARAVATNTVRVRKPEQNTKPKLFYIDAEEVSIVPGLASQDDGMLWAGWPETEGTDWRGPLQFGESTMAGALTSTAAAARETYNVPHRLPWHWPVPAYLVTKAIAAGAFIVGAGGAALGLVPASLTFTVIAPMVAILFTLITSLLLIADLDRPERFWMILFRPQWRSWLTKGAYVLLAYGAVVTIYLFAQLAGLADLARLAVWPGVALAVLTAAYTGFLFAQAEGRDLWQSPLLPAHLVVQALMTGSAALLAIGVVQQLAAAVTGGQDATAFPVLVFVLGASLLVNLLLVVGGEFAVPHASQVAATAARMITRGRYKPLYRASLLIGGLLPLVLVALAGANPLLMALAGLLAIAGLFAYEWAFVMAPQQVPNN